MNHFWPHSAQIMSRAQPDLDFGSHTLGSERVFLLHRQFWLPIGAHLFASSTMQIGHSALPKRHRNAYKANIE
jgi:hypothetical protein